MCLEMANPQPVEPRPLTLDESLSEAKATAREQLEAALQIQIGRLIEQFSSGWQAQVQQILEERLADLDATIQAHYLTAHDRRRRELFARLSQSARRLRQFENEDQWSRALIESTAGLCDRAILFAVNGPMLEFRAARGVEAAAPPPPVPIAFAPAFASAIETKDTVVALRTRGELSNVVSLTGESADRRCSLFPFLARDRVAAILYADAEDGNLETSALDLIATLGAAVLDGLRDNTSRQSGTLLTIFGAPPAPARQTTWASLNKNEQELHLRAQRFARVQVAEMRLYKSQAVKNGRVNADLYSYLKYEIDTGREAFRRDFLSASPSMADYFHLELVQTLANDDAALLGKEYPGPMVAVG